MKIIREETVGFRSELKITDDVLKMIIDSFIIEYNVDRSSMPDITGDLLCRILDRKDDSEEIKIEGKNYAFSSFLNEFLLKHLDDNDIPGLKMEQYIIPNASATPITYLSD